MKTFKEMLETAADRRELNQIILATPELKKKYRMLTRTENEFYKVAEMIFDLGNMNGCDALTPDEQAANNATLRELGKQIINDDIMCRFIDMAANPLRFEAYKILCEREREGATAHD